MIHQVFFFFLLIVFHSLYQHKKVNLSRHFGVWRSHCDCFYNKCFNFSLHTLLCSRSTKKYFIYQEGLQCKLNISHRHVRTTWIHCTHRFLTTICTTCIKRKVCNTAHHQNTSCVLTQLYVSGSCRCHKKLFSKIHSYLL